MARDDLPIGDVLLDIALQFGSTLDLKKLVAVVLERFAELSSAEHAVFMLCGPSGDIEHAVVHNAEWSGDLEQLPISYGLVEKVVRSGEIVSVRDLVMDETMGVFDSVKFLGIRMFVGVPVIADEQVVAVL